mmetsp:Transcript_38672/g.121134  ORF Transcript_38672/g.121134 Transcript_38672/m.121134 type:complete len:162 (+) Transcript_38672:116-601(+)
MRNYCEDLMYADWPKWSNLGGKISTVVSIVSGFVGCLIGTAIGICVYTIFITFVYAFFELPQIYACIEPCQRLNFKLTDEDNQYNFSNGLIRGVFHIGLSIPMYIGNSICILPAILWGLTGLMYWAKYFQARWEKTETEAYNNMEGQQNPAAQGSNKFGTF